MIWLNKNKVHLNSTVSISITDSQLGRNSNKILSPWNKYFKKMS